MLGRSWALAVLPALLASGTAWAAPATVQLRVEGSSTTLFEGPVTTDGKTIDKGDGPHPCDGTSGGGTPGPTMTSALDDGAITNGFAWAGTWFGFGDFGVDAIGGEANDPANPPPNPPLDFGGSYWGYALNLVPAQVGGCQQKVQTGDEVLFGFDFFHKAHLLRIDGPPTVAAGQPVSLRVTDGSKPTDTPVAGASLTGVAGAPVTGPGGSVSVTFDSPGTVRLKAERADSIRSAAFALCVSGPAAPCSAATSGPAAGDSRAPRARVSAPRDGVRLGRGPRVLRGRASDENGITEVKLALRRHVRGHNCRWWSGRRERFVGKSCRKVFFFAIGSDSDWSYLLPRRLPAGRYVLDVKAFDRNRNRDERFVRGTNRVVFDVGPAARAAAAGGRHASPAAIPRRARSVPVEVMVQGRERALVSPRTVSARATLVTASGHRCRVGAATPLAALAAALRKGPSVRIRDFGRCSRHTGAGSGLLFVSRVDRDRNTGNDGWFYKVGGRAGTAGSADPAGPLGHGLLKRGDRVLWFYCRFDAAASSCQRTLRVRPAARTVAVGEALDVRVIGFDNEGRAAPVGSALVRLGTASATTGPDGRARVVAPEAGRQDLRAERAGDVPSFPERVTVR